jgi:hypothetical protein
LPVPPTEGSNRPIGGGGGASDDPLASDIEEPATPGRESIQQFTSLNAFQYLELQTRNKFPRDVVGTLSAGTSPCARIFVFDEQLEVCWIKDTLSLLKIPVWISFLLYMITSL